MFGCSAFVTFIKTYTRVLLKSSSKYSSEYSTCLLLRTLYYLPHLCMLLDAHPQLCVSPLHWNTHTHTHRSSSECLDQLVALIQAKQVPAKKISATTTKKRKAAAMSSTPNAKCM
jgi:hypothetical protein